MNKIVLMVCFLHSVDLLSAEQKNLSGMNQRRSSLPLSGLAYVKEFNNPRLEPVSDSKNTFVNFIACELFQELHERLKSAQQTGDKSHIELIEAFHEQLIDEYFNTMLEVRRDFSTTLNVLTLWRYAESLKDELLNRPTVLTDSNSFQRSKWEEIKPSSFDVGGNDQK